MRRLTKEDMTYVMSGEALFFDTTGLDMENMYESYATGAGFVQNKSYQIVHGKERYNPEENEPVVHVVIGNNLRFPPEFFVLDDHTQKHFDFLKNAK